MLQCQNCNARLGDNAVFCGNCGRQVAPLQARGATVGYNKGAGMNDDATIQSIENLPRPGPNVQTTKARNYAAAPDTPQAGTLYSPPPANSRRVPTARIALIAALVILVIAGGTIAAVALSSKVLQRLSFRPQKPLLSGPQLLASARGGGAG